MEIKDNEKKIIRRALFYEAVYSASLDNLESDTLNDAELEKCRMARKRLHDLFLLLKEELGEEWNGQGWL
jgi:hypothetical protein